MKKWTALAGNLLFCALRYLAASALAQPPARSFSAACVCRCADCPSAGGRRRPRLGILEWVPPALAELSAQAVAKESFTLDRTMLAAAAGLMPDSDADVRQAVASSMA